MVEVLKSYIALSNILILLCLILLVIGLLTKRNFVKQICFNSVALLFCLFILEKFVLGKDSNITRSGGYTNKKEYFKKSKGLGYSPTKKSQTISSIKLYEQDTIYNVNYTFKNGMRHTPNSNQKSNKYKLFLGCSQTFGEGLNDNETLPFYFNKNSKIKYNVRNYGFHGYGAHQVLYIVENIISKDKALKSKAENIEVIYNFYGHHIARAAGYSSWDNKGPRYEFENNRIKFKGQLFTKNRFYGHKTLHTLYDKIWIKSNLYKTLMSKLYYTKDTDKMKNEDIIRTLQIIKKIKDDLSKQGINFVLLLNENSFNNDFINNFLLENNVLALCLECEIENYESNPDFTIEHDGHSTALLNKYKGKILANKLKTRK